MDQFSPRQSRPHFKIASIAAAGASQSKDRNDKQKTGFFDSIGTLTTNGKHRPRHRTRALLIRQQTMLANAFRAHLAELGIVVSQGIRHVRALTERVFGEGADAIDLPALARTALRPLVAQLMELRLQIKTIEKELLAWHRTSQESLRLETIPGVGFITATAIAATVTDPSHFRSSREFSAWLGLTPRQLSHGPRRI